MLSNPVETEGISRYKSFSDASPIQSTINFFNNDSVSCSTNSNEEVLVGGRDQVWKNKIKNISQRHVKQTDPSNGGKDKVKSRYEQIRNNFSVLDCPITLEPKNSTFDDIAMHALFRQRLSLGTVERNTRYMRFMEHHDVPINFREPTFENFIHHADYREQIEGKGWGALKHEWQAMTMVLTAYGIPWGKGQRWHYKPPSRIQMNNRRLPSPLEIYKLIHYKYNKGPYENALIQYSLMHAYQIGWRVPSEPCAMIVDNVDFDNGILTVIEPKKHRRERPLILDGTLMYDHRRKSLKNWIDHWRPKVANQHSGNALYLRPDGRPITDEQFRSLLSKKVKPAHLQIRKELGLTNWDDKRYIYYPNQPRHWVGTGKIVEEYIRTKGHWNDDKVRRWLGHTKEGALKHYIVDAEQYIKLYPYDWFKRLLKFHVNDFDMGGVKPQKSVNRIA